ncbi:ABC transporter permease [Thalassotalea profundi]|uniref:ABC transporter permease n=1 Tax=Thalassotalea profundi TaxID=2036687 RepID=A0ABQ3II49_9GAMM|nr:FtsX-like permease family protein [Thalassotalea profundi]GHE83363.1 ABC transporter permease [Thalassotalea profundi]
MEIKKSTSWYSHSLRLLKNEIRRGELTIIFLAIVLAVATVFSLAGFTEQIKQAIVTSSTNTIAADRVLRLNSPASTEILSKSKEEKLRVARKIETESMAFAGDNMLLAEINAISSEYPLRGELRIKTSEDQQDTILVNGPPEGSVWVEASVLSRMQVDIGDTIEIGVLPLTIGGIVTDIPDRSYRAFIAGPSIFLNIDDMEKTELIQPGSRLEYKYLFAGEQDNIESFEKWLTPQLNDTQRWYDAKAAQNRLSRVLDSAEKFLSLASMLGIVLAAVAVAVASRRYGQRHQATVAVFKALGATINHISKVYIMHWGLLSVISITVGLLLGYGLILLGQEAVKNFIELDNTTLTLMPFITAIATGLICAIAFAIHPLSELMKTSPLLVIRGMSQLTKNKMSLHHAIPLVALFVLLFMFSQDLKMSASLLFGGLLVSLVLLGFGKLLMTASRSAGTKAGKALHLALANLKRRANENSVQLVSFTIAIQLLLLITVMKTSIIEEWQEQFPEGTPNHYLMNITEQQVQPLSDYVEQEGIANQGFYPVYRGRLAAINDEKTVSKRNRNTGNDNELATEKSDSEEEGRRGMGRELGLTWFNEVQPNNEVIEGTWWESNDQMPQVSVESNVAERLDIKLGDELTFTLATNTLKVPVTSIRKVNWQSRQLNFIMVFNKAALEQIETTSISAWMVPEDKKNEVYKFLSEFPTISIMDFGAIMKQLNKMIEQVSVAIELILVLVILAGSLVLVAQVQASMEERERELAILRTLGAKGSLLRNSVLFEFVALGAIAGLMASVAMEIAVYLLQTQVFQMDPSFHFDAWVIGIGAGASFVGVMGMLSCWRLLSLSSVTLIRRTM